MLCSFFLICSALVWLPCRTSLSNLVNNFVNWNYTQHSLPSSPPAALDPLNSTLSKTQQLIKSVYQLTRLTAALQPYFLLPHRRSFFPLLFHIDLPLTANIAARKSIIIAPVRSSLHSASLISAISAGKDSASSSLSMHLHLPFNWSQLSHRRRRSKYQSTPLTWGNNSPKSITGNLFMRKPKHQELGIRAQWPPP